MSVSPVPENFNTVSAYLVLKNASEGLEFYSKAFGMETIVILPGPGGEGVMHAEMRFGNSVVMMTDENPQFGMVSPAELPGSAVSLHVYVPDVDAAFAQATEAGCEVLAPPTDMFWGDRFGKLKDPFGHVWSLASHIEDVPPEEMATRAEAFMKEMAEHTAQGGDSAE